MAQHSTTGYWAKLNSVASAMHSSGTVTDKAEAASQPQRSTLILISGFTLSQHPVNNLPDQAPARLHI